mgnify:CR=1 FL=1
MSTLFSGTIPLGKFEREPVEVVDSRKVAPARAGRSPLVQARALVEGIAADCFERDARGTDSASVRTGGAGCRESTEGSAASSWRARTSCSEGVQADGCTWAGVEITGTGDRVEQSVLSHNAAGVVVKSGSVGAKVLDNQIVDNNKMFVLTRSPNNDDSGAFGVLLNGDGAEVASNRISGSDAFSYDYGRDGAAVEVYGGQGNNVHHNVAVDNHDFSELGNPRSADNTFAYNLVRSSLAGSTFLVTRGGASSLGPVTHTRVSQQHRLPERQLQPGLRLLRRLQPRHPHPARQHHPGGLEGRLCRRAARREQRPLLQREASVQTGPSKSRHKPALRSPAEQPAPPP